LLTGPMLRCLHTENNATTIDFLMSAHPGHALIRHPSQVQRLLPVHPLMP